MMSSILLPPGIKNDENICFASSILQCLFNLGVFRKVLADVGVSHVPACDICKDGWYIKRFGDINVNMNFTEKDKCVIAVLHNMCRAYGYSKKSYVLPSVDLVQSLEGRLVY